MKQKIISVVLLSIVLSFTACSIKSENLSVTISDYNNSNFSNTIYNFKDILELSNTTNVTYSIEEITQYLNHTETSKLKQTTLKPTTRKPTTTKVKLTQTTKPFITKITTTVKPTTITTTLKPTSKYETTMHYSTTASVITTFQSTKPFTTLPSTTVAITQDLPYASSDAIKLFIEFVNMGISNQTNAVNCVTDYIKTQDPTYQTYFYEFIHIAYDAVGEAYGMSLEYKDMQSMSYDLQCSLNILYEIINGSYPPMELVDMIGESVGYLENVVDECKRLAGM